MKITVVSGTYNRLNLLQKMMDSARQSVPPGIELDFVIVDGGSTDGTQEWLYEDSDTLLIEHGELRGAIPAFCDGAKAATGKYVILANDDIVFRGDSILRALVHLETNPDCGAVAFADNRPALPWKSASEYRVMPMAAFQGGKSVSVNYAQVGMFRRWLGNYAGWWGADDPEFPARTYAGDNYLSSRIWEAGYTVDAVPGVEVEDLVHEDELRRINGNHKPDGSHPDSEAYFRRFPKGANISARKKIHSPEGESLRVLYLPIFEPGHNIQLLEKRGLRNALMQRGFVYEIDYLGIPERQLHERLEEAVRVFQPHLILSQIQAPTPLDSITIRRIRAVARSAVWVNWNGDVWRDGLISEKMLELLKWVDLQLCINESVLPIYEKHGIPAAYWQIGFESGAANRPNVNSYDVVFLANAYTEERKKLEPVLREFRSGVFGSGWERPAGKCLYDFTTGREIYRKALISIGDNQYPKERGFVSNRLFQALAAGGAMLLHQTVPGLEELTGLKDGVHYVSWENFDDLRAKISYYLNHPAERERIAQTGMEFVHENHSFTARVSQLFGELLQKAKRLPREKVTLQYTGKRKKAFGIPGVGMFEPGQQFITVTPEQAQQIMQRDISLWQVVERKGLV